MAAVTKNRKFLNASKELYFEARISPLSLYRSPDNRMILKQISKGDNHYLKKQQPS
jgi:hypothetical protein